MDGFRWFRWGFFHLPGEPIDFSKRPPMVTYLSPNQCPTCGTEMGGILAEAFLNQKKESEVNIAASGFRFSASGPP